MMNKCLHCGARLRLIVGAVAVVASLMALCAAAFGSQAVAYQIDPAHTGSQSDGLTPPLTQRWSRDLGGPISYPLIAEGKVFVIVSNIGVYGTKLYALDQATGATVWGPIADNNADYNIAGLAYDAGRIFVVNFDGIVRAFDASSGALLWADSLDSNSIYAFTSPPTAFAGTVYVGGSGFGGRLFALSEQDGTLKWSAFAQNGEHSSPAVSSSGVYVSNTRLHVYDFSPDTGALIWEHSRNSGGGGRTPVLFNNRLYVRDLFADNGLVLDATTGAELGTFPRRSLAPAFSGSTGYFVGQGTMQARDATSLSTKWSFNGDSNIVTAPIVVNGYVYVGSYNGTLYALDANTGVPVWIGNLGAHLIEPDEDSASLLTGFAAADGLLVGSAEHTLFAFQSAPPAPPTAPIIELSSSLYSVREEAGHVNVIVTRNTLTGTATVNYATSDPGQLINCNIANGLASSRCDYATSKGTLRFAAGEPSKTISIPIVDDNFAEGNEIFTLTLSNPVGASFGSNTKAVITIIDNLNAPTHPLNQTDFFVRQHYIDFLGREPDPAGYQGWINILDRCRPGDKTCDPIEVSSAFFRSQEFQERGYFIYRFYSVALGRKPDYAEFIPDLANVSGFLTEAEKEANKVAFVDEFMSRQEFKNRYDAQTTATAYVETLLATAGLPNHPSRAGWIAGLTNGTLTRAQVLRQLAESAESYSKFYNEAFVVMQYFGYLRRDPDIFYLDWIKSMNQNGDYRRMIDGFLNSQEYRQRFGP